MHLAVGVLKLPDGCDYSAVIGKEELNEAEEEKKDEEGSEKKDEEGSEENLEVVVKPSNETAVEQRHRQTSVSLYHDVDGNPLEKKIMDNITQFQAKKRKGNIDVWWLYDDGGLTLLLPYILTTRAQFADCSMRVFALANRRDELDRETRNMASLLAKFRIDYSDVIVIPDVTKKATDDIKAEFKEMTDKVNVDEAELLANKEKTNRNLRLAELLRENSKDSEMVIM